MGNVLTFDSMEVKKKHNFLGCLNVLRKFVSKKSCHHTDCLPRKLVSWSQSFKENNHVNTWENWLYHSSMNESYNWSL